MVCIDARACRQCRSRGTFVRSCRNRTLQPIPGPACRAGGTGTSANRLTAVPARRTLAGHAVARRHHSVPPWRASAELCGYRAACRIVLGKRPRGSHHAKDLCTPTPAGGPRWPSLLRLCHRFLPDVGQVLSAARSFAEKRACTLTPLDWRLFREYIVVGRRRRCHTHLRPERPATNVGRQAGEPNDPLDIADRRRVHCRRSLPALTRRRFPSRGSLAVGARPFLRDALAIRVLARRVRSSGPYC
jgi:hypothetical protein